LCKKTGSFPLRTEEPVFKGTVLKFSTPNGINHRECFVQLHQEERLVVVIQGLP